MTAPKKLTYLTVEQYLESEAHAAVRREYVDGQVFAMTGATRRHNIIVGNIHSLLRAHLRGSRCRAYFEAVKARVEAANCFYYPDVMVACDAFDSKSVFSDSPVLVVEVLSPSTAATDRREKRVNYMKIETLKELVFVHQAKKRVELQRRNPDGDWDVIKLLALDELVLESLPNGVLAIPMSAIYEEVDFDTSEDGSLDLSEEEAEYEFADEEELAALDY